MTLINSVSSMRAVKHQLSLLWVDAHSNQSYLLCYFYARITNTFHTFKLAWISISIGTMSVQIKPECCFLWLQHSHFPPKLWRQWDRRGESVRRSCDIGCTVFPVNETGDNRARGVTVCGEFWVTCGKYGVSNLLDQLLVLWQSRSLNLQSG